MKRTYISPETICISIEQTFAIAVSGKVDGDPAISGGDEGGNPGGALAPRLWPNDYWEQSDEEKTNLNDSQL